MDKIKNILIFGGNGLVGQSFKRILQSKKDYNIFTTSRNPNKDQITCDITNAKSIEQCFLQTHPDLVINCTNLAGGVNFCEENPKLSEQFHFEANKTIGSLSSKLDIPFVLISTDYVFDGSAGPYQEEDIKNPLNAYGHHKLKAEEWITNNTTKHIIARTTNVFGWDPDTKTPNYLMQLYFNLKEGKKVNAPSFLSGNPTYADDLAQAIIDLISREKFGIFHVVGDSNINRYDWAVKFCQALNFDQSLLQKTEKAPQGIVPRPFDSNLNTLKLQNAIGYKLSSVDEGLKKFKYAMTL